MNIVDQPSEPLIKNLWITEDDITALLTDGRTISVPLAWSWRLSEASSEQRNKFEIIGDGQGVHWPDIDEDISAEGMLFGMPAKRPRQHLAQIGGEKMLQSDAMIHKGNAPA